MEDNRLSLENVFRLRSKAFAEISEHAFAIDAIAAAIADLDVAMTCFIDERSIDEMQGLVTAARQLADAMDGGQA